MKMRVLSKFISLMLVMIMVLSITACGKSGSDSASSTSTDKAQESTANTEKPQDDKNAESAKTDEPVTIRFSWWGGDSRHKATEAAVQAFMKKNPNIKVEVEYGAWDGWPEKVATQLSSGTAPDLMQINWNWLYQFSADGAQFADLREFDDIISLSNYPESFLKDTTVADKLQAIPLGTTGKAFFWNKSTFDKAGIAVPTTIDELIAAGETFKTKLGEDYYPMAMYEYERMIFMLYYLQSKYGQQWVENGKLNYTVEQVKEGLDWINSLEKAHVLPSIAQLKGDGANILEKNPKWIDGHYAGFYEWDSANNKMKEALAEGQEFILGDFITGIGEHEAGLTKISMTFAITEASQHKKEAAMLMEFLTSDPEGVEIMSTERGMLVNDAANKVLVEKGLLSGLTYEANQKVLEVANFSFDPNFENSALKDSTGVYYEVFEGISGGADTAEMAQYLVDSVNEVNAANPY